MNPKFHARRSDGLWSRGPERWRNLRTLTNNLALPERCQVYYKHLTRYRTYNIPFSRGNGQAVRGCFGLVESAKDHHTPPFNQTIARTNPLHFCHLGSLVTTIPHAKVFEGSLWQFFAIPGRRILRLRQSAKLRCCIRTSVSPAVDTR
jgi:hypothetical protein